MASNYTQHQLLQRVAVLTNKEYDDFVMNKKYFDLWHKAHAKERTNARTSRLKRFLTRSKKG